MRRRRRGGSQRRRSVNQSSGEPEPVGTNFVGLLPEIAFLRQDMRIRITEPLTGSIDGIQLDRFRVGETYDMGTTLASYLMAVGAARPLWTKVPAGLSHWRMTGPAPSTTPSPPRTTTRESSTSDEFSRPHAYLDSIRDSSADSPPRPTRVTSNHRFGVTADAAARLVPPM
jgi:hypothetical protein